MKKSNTFLLVLIFIFLSGILGLVINFMFVNERKIGAITETHIQSNKNYDLLIKNYEQTTYNYDILVDNFRKSNEALEQSNKNYQLLLKNYKDIIDILKEHEEINKNLQEYHKTLDQNDSIIIERLNNLEK